MTHPAAAPRVPVRRRCSSAAAAMALAPALAATIERRLGEIARRAGAPDDAERRSQRPDRTRSSGSGSVAPQSPSRDGQAAAAAGRRRLPQQRSAHRVLRHSRRRRARAASRCWRRRSFVRPNVLLALGAAGLGYVLPSMVLGAHGKRRQHRIRLSLPDALDLLVVSVEAGLGLDQAMQRVGDELAFAHPELCEELRLINLELRAGKARSEALHNLAERTGVDDVVVAGGDAGSDRQVRHERGAVAARALRHAADEAPSARGRGGGQDRREDGLPAGALHFSGDLGRDARSGGDQVRQVLVSDGASK